MKKQTADALKEAREQRAVAKAAADAIAERLTNPDWNEETDGPAFETAKRSLSAAVLLVDRLTDQLETEARAAGWNAPSDSPGISVNVITNPTKDDQLPSKFRLNRALRAALGQPDPENHGRKQNFDGIEKEMHEEAILEARSAKVADFAPDGSIMIPAMCAFGERSRRSATSMSERERRDLIVGTAANGGYAVATNLGEMIPFLDPNTPLRQMGATMLTDLVGNLDLPRRLTRATGVAVAEQAALTESSPTLNKLSLAPKRQGTYIEASLMMIQQSSVDVENLIRSDLQQALTELQELYAINGSGSSNQPTGILATAGIGSVVGGTNGLIPAWSHIVALETALGNANALKGMLGYLTTPGIAGITKQAKRDVAGNGFIWEGRNDGSGNMNGYKAMTSTIVPSTLTKGTASAICHAIIMGNFQELIMAYWGGVQLIVDPYSLATTGSVRVTANTFFDVGVRHSASFAAMVDALAA